MPLKKSKRKGSGLCSIRRTFKQTHGTLNLVTGRSKKERSEIVTEPCNNPLFGDDEIRRGICRTCSSGWEHKDNGFASPKEKARATSAH